MFIKLISLLITWVIIGHINAAIVTTDIDEHEFVKEIIEVISQDGCAKLTRDLGAVCCAPQGIIKAIESIIGLNNIGLCDIYKSQCDNNECSQGDQSALCAPECPEPSPEAKELERQLLSGEITVEQLLEMILVEAFEDKPLEGVDTGAGEGVVMEALAGNQPKRRSLDSIITTVLQNKRK